MNTKTFEISSVEGYEHRFTSCFQPYNYVSYIKKKLNLLLSIDFLILSLNKNIKQLTSLLTTISMLSFNSRFYVTKSSSIKSYFINFNGRIITVKYIHFYKGTHFWIRIDDPDKDFLQYLSHLISPVGYNVVQVEFTFDFFGPNIHSIYNQLKSTYFLSYASSSKQFSFNYTDTEYSNDLRKTKSKGLRLYKKRNDKKELVSARLELLYKKTKLKKMKINSIDKVLKIKCNDILQPLHFKYFNYDKFIKNYVNRMEKGVPECREDLSKVLENIHKLIKNKNILSGDKYAREFISYSCCDTHPFEFILKFVLYDQGFFNGETFVIPYDFLFDPF